MSISFITQQNWGGLMKFLFTALLCFSMGTALANSKWKHEPCVAHLENSITFEACTSKDALHIEPLLPHLVQATAGKQEAMLKILKTAVQNGSTTVTAGEYDFFSAEHRTKYIDIAYTKEQGFTAKVHRTSSKVNTTLYIFFAMFAGGILYSTRVRSSTFLSRPFTIGIVIGVLTGLVLGIWGTGNDSSSASLVSLLSGCISGGLTSGRVQSPFSDIMDSSLCCGITAMVTTVLMGLTVTSYGVGSIEVLNGLKFFLLLMAVETFTYLVYTKRHHAHSGNP
jgi:hypothetical protein